MENARASELTLPLGYDAEKFGCTWNAVRRLPGAMVVKGTVN